MHTHRVCVRQEGLLLWWQIQTNCQKDTNTLACSSSPGIFWETGLLVLSWPLAHFHSRAERRASGHSGTVKFTRTAGFYVGQQMALRVTCKAYNPNPIGASRTSVIECNSLYLWCVHVRYKSRSNCLVNVHFMLWQSFGGNSNSS